MTNGRNLDEKHRTSQARFIRVLYARTHTKKKDNNIKKMHLFNLDKSSQYNVIERYYFIINLGICFEFDLFYEINREIIINKA